MQPCRGKYCDERWAQLHPGCIARAAPDKGMNMQRRWDNHRWNYTAFLLTGFDCSISSCLQNPTESASWLGFSMLPLRSLVAPCHLSVPRGCSQARSSRSASQGWCMRDALAPGGWKHYFPVDNGYPSAHTALLRAPQQQSLTTARAQPCPGVHLHPVPISLATWGCSHCLHSLLGELFPTFICTELEHSSPPHAITASHSPRRKAEVF